MDTGWPAEQEGGPEAETQECWAARASLASKAPSNILWGGIFLYIPDPLIPVTQSSQFCRTCFLRLRNNFIIRIPESQTGQEPAALRGFPGTLLWTIWESEVPSRNR